MSMCKNKSTMFAIMRKDLARGQDVVCAFAKTLGGAERLCDEYQQAFTDSGGHPDESYFYTVANTYYDE